MSELPTPFDVIKWLTNKKPPDNVNDVIENKKTYNAFIINKNFSKFLDLVYYANEMNSIENSTSPFVMQYAFYDGVIKKGARFVKWDKKNKDVESSRQQLLNMIKQKYGYSEQVASQVALLYNDEQIEQLKKDLDVGGKK